MELHAQLRNPSQSTVITLTIIFSGFLAFAYGFGIYLFPILGPDMKDTLGFNYSQMGYIAAGIQAGFILSSILSGIFAPKIGELRFIWGSMILCGLCLIVLSQVQSPLQAALVLVLIGFVPASTWVPMVAVIRRFVPYSRRGIVFGFLSGSGGYGAIINGQAVPSLQEAIGWRGIWLGTGAVVLVFAIASILILRYMGVVDESGSESAPPSTNLMEITGLDSRTLKVAVHLWAIMILGAAVMISYQTFFTAFIRDHLGADRLVAGRMTFIHGCIGIIAAPLVGYLADRRGVRFCFGFVVLCTFLACFSIYLAQSLGLVAASAIFFGVSFYPFFALPPAYASKTMDTRTAVRVFAAGNVFVGGGALLGNLFGSSLLSIFGTLAAVFGGLSALTLVLAAVVFALPKEGASSDV